LQRCMLLESIVEQMARLPVPALLHTVCSAASWLNGWAFTFHGLRRWPRTGARWTSWCTHWPTAPRWARLAHGCMLRMAWSGRCCMHSRRTAGSARLTLCLVPVKPTRPLRCIRAQATLPVPVHSPLRPSLSTFHPLQVQKSLLETSRRGYLAAMSASSYSFVSLMQVRFQ